jgi:hypothetical protein
MQISNKQQANTQKTTHDPRPTTMSDDDLRVLQENELEDDNFMLTILLIFAPFFIFLLVRMGWDLFYFDARWRELWKHYFRIYRAISVNVCGIGIFFLESEQHKLIGGLVTGTLYVTMIPFVFFI